MGRPAIMSFDSFTDTAALDAAVSILKTEKNTTVTAVTDRFRKRVNVGASDEALFVARVRAALDTLASQGKVTITGDAVSVVSGKRGRPRKVVTATATA
jgi:hypothetical protein